MINFENVLVLAPHTDDGELGAGSFIAKLSVQGANIKYVAFSSAAESLPEGFPKDTLVKEVKLATSVLGISDIAIKNYPVRNFDLHRQEILDDLIKIRKENNFDLVLIPSTSDVHQDHQVIMQEGIRAFKNTTILGYELIWNSFDFKNHLYVKLDEADIMAKVNALQKYASQAHRPYMSEEFVRSLAYTRGLQVNHKYAECFEVIRWVIN